MRSLAFTACIFTFVVPVAAQATLAPSVAFSVHDEPVDGLGDSFNTFTGLIRTQSTRADRAMQEFDITAFAGMEIANATLSGMVNVNNSFNNGVRTFDFALYAGNGVADLTDYEIPATVVGTGSYQPPITSSFSYSFDVTSVLQTMIDCGVPFVGLKATGTSNPSFPNILSASASQLVITTGAAQTAWTDLGFATPGANGAPRLVGTGVLSPATTARLTICHAEPGLPGLLVFGFSRLDLPILGVTFVPNPIVAGGLDGNAVGMQSFELANFSGPGGAGAGIYLQYFALDASAPQGLAASNALETVVLP